jgi:hypothetical protein
MKRDAWTAGFIRALALITVTTLCVQTAAAELAFARRIIGRPAPGGAVGPGGVVTLPYRVGDNLGNQWWVYQNGAIRQDGNLSLYSQGAMLLVNGNNIQPTVNQGKMDEKTGELIIENMNAQNGVMVTRRVLLDLQNQRVRYIDVFKNTAAADVAVNLQIQTNLNYGINVAQMVADPKKKDQNMAWVAQTGAGPSVVEMFSGKGAKQAPTINWQNGNSVVQANMTLNVPAGKEVALLHYHGSAASQEAGVAWVEGLKDNELMKSIPTALRKLIVNFVSGQTFIGDVEVLRGDLLDVVELKGGDQIKGTLKAKSFKLTTFYGDVDLPVERVIGIINVGQFRARQLLVTVDGQIFGGTLAQDALELQLTSGQTTQIPLAQVSRAGYRKREGEPEEWKFDKPIVLMRTGERVGVQMPADAIEVVTRYGKLSLKPELIAAVLLQTEEHGVHEILLTDGSKFAGLLSADQFQMSLEAGAAAADKGVVFPASSIARLQLAGQTSEPGDDTPTVRLMNEDLLVGVLTGKLNVDTAFDTISVNAAEVKMLARPEAGGGGNDVQLSLWDGTTLSGQLQDQVLAVKLECGVDMKVPVALVQTYEQPAPQASKQMIERINEVVGNLNADDWKERDRAEAALLEMGPVAAGVLRKLRENQPPEAQQRIDTILKELEKQRQNERRAGNAGAAAPATQPQVFDEGFIIEN